MNLVRFPDCDTAAREQADRIAQAAAETEGRFAIALTGGSSPQATYRLLATPGYAERIDWSRWHVFMGDERQVPLDDERSNFRNASVNLLDRVPIPRNQLYPYTDADEYEGLLRSFFGEAPRFDMLLLGMGNDGHTASLFPGSVSLLEEERWSIEPPDVVEGMARLTLTMPALNAARRTLFLVCGEAKREPLAQIRRGDDLPAGRVRDAVWLVDEAAAGPD